MPALRKTQKSSYSVEQLYSIVADVEKYPEFLPWCKKLVIIEKNNNEIIADMYVNFKIFSEKFRSRVMFYPPVEDKAMVDVELIEGPFKNLVNKWRFYKGDNQQTMVDFYIDFTMKSHILNRIVGLVFEGAVEKMSKAFDKRAKELYSQNPNQLF